MSAFVGAGIICLILLVGITFDIGRDVRKIRRAVMVDRAVHVSVDPSQITDAEARRIRRHIRAATNGPDRSP